MVSAADNTTVFYQILLSPALTSFSQGEGSSAAQAERMWQLGDCLNYRFLKSSADMYLNVNLQDVRVKLGD